MMRLLALMLLASTVSVTSPVLRAQDEPPDRVKLRFEPQSGQILHTRISESRPEKSTDGKVIEMEVTTAFTATFDKVISRDEFDADVVVEELNVSLETVESEETANASAAECGVGNVERRGHVGSAAPGFGLGQGRCH